MRRSTTWFATVVVVIGAGCGDGEPWLDIFGVSVGDGKVDVEVEHELAAADISGSEIVFEVCPSEDGRCVIVVPTSDPLSIPMATRGTVSFPWSTPGTFLVTAGLRADRDDYFDPLTGQARFTYVGPDSGSGEAAPEVTTPAEGAADADAPETSVVDETTTTVDETTTAVAEGRTTTAPPTTVRTVTTTPTVGTTTTVAVNPAGGTAATSTTTSTTTTTSSTTTTTMPDYATTTTTQPVSGIGQWIRNDMTTCAYRGTMGCGIYRTQYEYFPDYGPVGGPGDMMPSTWGPVGQIAYSLYAGHEYGSCDWNGAGACGWYYDSSVGTYTMGAPVP